MNDTETKRVLDRLCSHVRTDVDLCNCLDPDCERCCALRHALQAIDDRAALINEMIKVTGLDHMLPEHVVDKAIAARRHMHGEE